MNTVILSNINEVEKIIIKSNQFADDIGSSLPFHRIQFPCIWWKHFNSEDNSDFGSKRGVNFFGAKSWLKRISFILVEDEGKILGIAPLFISVSVLRGRSEPIKLLSFIPDSGMIFYQDLLIHPQYREEVITKIFQCIEKLIVSEDMILFLGHIPEDSLNLKYYSKEIDSRLKNGWSGGRTVNCRRSGVYFWNIPILCMGLRAGLYKLSSNDEEIKTKVKNLINSLESQTTALMFFKGTREKFEKKILDILRIYEEKKLSSRILHSISEVFETKPVIYPYRDLPKNTDELYASLSSSKRYFYRRYMRKFLAEGGTFENIDPKNITLPDFKDYLSLHIDRWGTKSGTVIDQTIKFHHELSLSMAGAGYFRLFFARYGGKRIAALASFDVGNRREFFGSGRSLNYSKPRAGKLLVLYSILDAIENGFGIFDFGYGYEEYKFDFTKSYRTVRSFLLTKNNDLPDLEKLFPIYDQIVL